MSQRTRAFSQTLLSQTGLAVFFGSQSLQASSGTEVEGLDDQLLPLLSVSTIDASAFDLAWWGRVDFRRRDMTDDRTKQLVDRNRIFLELQQLTIDEYKIKQRIP